MNVSIEGNDKPITVRLRVEDGPKPLTPAKWSDWVDWELAKAGVPIDDGVLLRGTIRSSQLPRPDLRAVAHADREALLTATNQR